MEIDSRGPARPRQTVLTPRDPALLGFAAQHRLILAGHAQALLGVSERAAQRRLRALLTGGYMVSRRVFAGQPSCYQISRAGLAAVGSDLAPPRLDLGTYAHDVGLAWLWLAAARGAFGPVREILAERTLRSEDARAAAAGRACAPRDAIDDSSGQPYGVRLGGLGPQGRERLHYPDLLLITPDGLRVAVELELTTKGRARRDRILTGYGCDARVSAVLYLVEHAAVGRAVESSARRLGIDSLVHVQQVHESGKAQAGTAGHAATRARTDSRDVQR